MVLMRRVRGLAIGVWVAGYGVCISPSPVSPSLDSPTGVSMIWSGEALLAAVAESLLSRSTLSLDRIWKVLPLLSMLSWDGRGEDGMRVSSTFPDIALLRDIHCTHTQKLDRNGTSVSATIIHVAMH
jgi:hypothetical protein